MRCIACDAPLTYTKTFTTTIQSDLCNECRYWVQMLLREHVSKEDIEVIFGIDEATEYMKCQKREDDVE